MKVLFYLLFALCFSFSACAQKVVFDQQVFNSISANTAARTSAEDLHNNYLGKIKTNIQNINTNMGSVVLAQDMIYYGLSQVNSALKDGLMVKNMAVISADIESYLGQSVTLAKGQPYLLLFASDIENEMRLKAVAMVKDVSSYILKEGDNVLADFEARDELLRKVLLKLQLIDGLAYGAWRAMYWAKENGIIASANPYANYISQDKNFVDQIIFNAKYLKQ